MWDRYTNEDGRLGDLIDPEDFTRGVYKLRFDTAAYYDVFGLKCFYPFVEVAFNIEDPKQHYHVPLLLSPYGYSTYRGS